MFYQGFEPYPRTNTGHRMIQLVSLLFSRIINLVPRVRFELTQCLAPRDFKSLASTNSAIRAHLTEYSWLAAESIFHSKIISITCFIFK